MVRTTKKNRTKASGSFAFWYLIFRKAIDCFAHGREEHAVDWQLDQILDDADRQRCKARRAVKHGQEYGVELPIVESVYKVLFDGTDIKEALGTLFMRSVKKEF